MKIIRGTGLVKIYQAQANGEGIDFGALVFAKQAVERVGGEEIEFAPSHTCLQVVAERIQVEIFMGFYLVLLAVFIVHLLGVGANPNTQIDTSGQVKLAEF